ncbi:carbohydrate ABC transporter permease [Kitasatospora viridis]|uniref:Carbohydrate ABC transporter membrane protein 1 (CUT1 family) n=1 Tax=Kitasatospora viridis TaxID=281105 RepID=A0A561SEJ0_9ACTN|nr:sugar ABC transporter permease [Kitasatospora viridis]TWF73257.1 carbohydrate ABC transporter membrane protein 1 (CUT1 family) [Kitasatospora viridis]
MTAARPGPAASGPARARAARRRWLARNLRAHGFLAGALLCFVLFTWYPMVREITMSFQRVHHGATSWVGLANYRQITADPEFWSAWRNTLEFTGLALVLGFALPFLAAIVINELRHAQAYLRILVYLPVMLPPVAGILLFKYFMDPGYGLFDQVLHALHLPGSAWLASKDTAMPSLVLVSTWSNMGSATLVYLAALQGIPGELYEAAELDGANLLQRVRHVTVPQTRLILSLMLVLQVVATMQMFTEAFVLTGGGPEGSTTTVVYLLYDYAFSYDKFNTAAALGVIMLVVLGCFSALYLWLERRGRED